jgi:hypothetical protein
MALSETSRREVRNVGHTVHVLGLVLIVLKAHGLVAYSWWWAWSPHLLLSGVGVALLVYVMYAIARAK